MKLLLSQLEVCLDAGKRWVLDQRPGMMQKLGFEPVSLLHFYLPSFRLPTLWGEKSPSRLYLLDSPELHGTEKPKDWLCLAWKPGTTPGQPCARSVSYTTFTLL